MCRQFSDRCIDLRSEDEEELLDEFRPDLILIAPGISRSRPVFVQADKMGIPVIGENDFAAGVIQEFWDEQPFIIAVTGTDGKSTTTALIAHLIANASEKGTVACGNFGRPLSSIAADDEYKREPPVLVVECSSFQLESHYFFRPRISMILNIARDHMDRYCDMKEYEEAKFNIIKNCNSEDLLITTEKIAKKIKNFYGTPPARVEVFDRSDSVKIENGEISVKGSFLLKREDFLLRGNHNRDNLCFALIAFEEYMRCEDISFDLKKAADAIRSFRGLPHRMEILGEKNNILFVNDSKATTLQSVIAALDGFLQNGSVEIYLLCGGRDKGADFTLLPFENKSVRYFAFGEAVNLIFLAAKKFKDSNVSKYSNLQDAFQAAVNYIERAGGRKQETKNVILLSPGCASQDAYKSYQERGEHFRSLFREYGNG